ncbi:GyrI-like domain-containing protein [Pedobacter sp. SYSU D00535]|uniref:GyrI-like domain-containing protein n=1 Tax=Pedobacter sp. SYSU D00535 TaxID=2810308 RepID=UPI001A972335|nr:GyrI-like domain-containing protein [Pedobacter sp. SYSU D00535]
MKAQGKDFVVAKLEGQWWYDMEKYGLPTAAETPLQVPRSEWEYRSLIRIPDFVGEEDVEQAKLAIMQKKQNPLAQSVEFFEIPAGAFVQMLHLGPFANEPESLKQMEEFIRNNGLQRNGHHQEIYLSDFRKTPAAKLRTILREPVA